MSEKSQFQDRLLSLGLARVSEAAALASVLQLDATALQAKLSQRHANPTTGVMEPDRFVYLARKVEVDVADRVKALALPGISFIDESSVANPSGTLARNLLGTVDVDNKTPHGPRDADDGLYAWRLRGETGAK